MFVAAPLHAAVAYAPVKNYPNIGFMFPCLDHAIPNPVPMPLAHPYISSDGDALIREDRFEPFELWYATQCCARWSDARGNRLVLGRITHHLPAFSDDLVSRRQFADELADDANLVDPKKKSDVSDWVAKFVNAAVCEPEHVKLNAFNLDDVCFFPCAATNTLVYAFRPRRIGNAKDFDWYCVILQATGTTDPEAFRKAFEERFMSLLALPSRGSAGEGEQSEEVSTPKADAKQPDQPNHPVRIEAKKSIENYDAWWFAETDGYIILSDVDTELGKSLIREIQSSMPVFRKAYERLVPPLTREAEVSLIRLFQRKDDYVRYVGKDLAWTGGVWMPGRRELVLAASDSKEDLMRVIRHEAFHQYLSYAYCMIPAAPWMNEGHACLFEQAGIGRKKTVSIDEDPARCAMLVDNIELVVSQLPRLLDADYPSFYGGNQAERNLKYAMAWGLAYYLQKGAPQERNSPFTRILPDFALSLAQTHAYSDATTQAFSAIDMPAFQDNFREFWLKRRASAMQYDPLEE